MFARALLLTAATIFLANPASAQAHRRSEFAVLAGAYLPTNQSGLGPGNVTADMCTEHPETPDCPTTHPKQSENGGAAIGGRWTGWLGKGAGIEGSLWWTSGGTGSTFLSSLRGVFKFAPYAQTSVVLLAGPAMVNRFDYADDMASFGGTVGIGLDIHPGHDFAFRAQIEDYMYSVQALFSTIS